MKQASLKQGLRLLKLVEETGWSRAEVQRRLIERWGLLRQIAEALDDLRLTEENVRAMHPLFYEKIASPFRSLLAACRLDWVSEGFNEMNFPLEPMTDDEAEWEVVEYHFDGVVTGEEAFRKLEAMGYRLLGGSRRAMEYITVHADLPSGPPLIVTASWLHQKDCLFAPVYSQGRSGKWGLDLVCLTRDFGPDHEWLVLKKRTA